MRWLVSTALRLRVALTALAIVLIAAGLNNVRKTPLDVFPEFAPPLVEIQTEGPGLSTSEIESLVTNPVESAMNGLLGLKTIRSKSVLGLSSVVLYFQEGTPLLPARQLVQERLATVTPQLPQAAKTPVILSPLSSTSRVMKIGVSSKTLDQIELTTLVRWTVRPRLMAIPGVANVAIWGQRDRQIQVLVNPERLRDHRVTLDEVMRVTRESAAPAPGGFVDTPNQRIALTHAVGIRSAADLAHVPVAFRGGTPLELGKVADVVEGHQQPIGDAVINDGPGLLLIVEKQPTGNTLDVTRNVEKALAELKPGLRDVEVDATIFRPATFIEMSLANLEHALLWGCLLVVAVLVAFLFEWRAAVISLTAIPVSLIAAAQVITWQGATINVMVLAGLAIALGEVVDDAIIDVENITRRLRSNAAAQQPRPAWQVVFDASLEVRSAVVYATLIVILVFVPVFYLDGLAGSFFRPLAWSYILAVLASLGVALTLTPALSLLLLRGTAERRDTILLLALKRAYRAILGPLIHHPWFAGATIAAAFAITAAALPYLGEEFLPSFQEYDFLMHWVEKPGTSLDAMRRITERASRELRSIPGVRNFGSHIGRAEVADEVVGPNFTELWISLDPKVEYKPTVARIQEVVDGYPGLYRDLLTYLKERIKEVLSGGSAAIVVRLFGPGLDELRGQAQRVAAAIQDIPGIASLQVEQQVLVPQLEIRIKPEAAARFGLNGGEVRRAATTLIRGAKAGEIYEDQRIFDIMVWGEPRVRTGLASLRAIRIDAPGGANLPLSDLAEIGFSPTPNLIAHENTSRKIDVSFNVRPGFDLGEVAREAERRVRQVPFERGYHPEFLGEYAARQQARTRLYTLGALSLLGILLLLYTDFESARTAALAFLTLPFALVGGVFAALGSSGVLSLGSLVGFVTVLGIAARNGIMLISHYRHLEREEGVAFGPELVLRGSLERLAPILMTALATGLALVPIVITGSRPGQEIEHPMAVVILGGLVTSTFMNLLAMPALYLRFGRSR